ncbi:MAG TPA: hypothetical protein VFT56_01040 [Sphingomonas sp.]|nr:hypothetical protein [Sphingomonas sp.]
MAKTPTSTQAEPTRPRPLSKDGRQLDSFGLPLAGPARAAALKKAGKRDPRRHPEDWAPAAPKE